MNQEFDVEIKEEAKNDIENAYDWYEEKSPNLGESFKKHVDKTIRAIELVLPLIRITVSKETLELRCII